MSLLVDNLGIPAVKLLRPAKHEDSGGFFSETYSKRASPRRGSRPTSCSTTMSCPRICFNWPGRTKGNGDGGTALHEAAHTS